MARTSSGGHFGAFTAKQAQLVLDARAEGHVIEQAPQSREGERRTWKWGYRVKLAGVVLGWGKSPRAAMEAAGFAGLLPLTAKQSREHAEPDLAQLADEFEQLTDDDLGACDDCGKPAEMGDGAVALCRACEAKREADASRRAEFAQLAIEADERENPAIVAADAVVNSGIYRVVARRTPIIGTNLVVYSAWERADGHSTITHDSEIGLLLGRVGSGSSPLPTEVNALPALSPERCAAVSRFHAAENERAYAAILRDYPEAAGGQRAMGEIEVIL